MNVEVSFPRKALKGKISLPSSKSISNRVLMIHAISRSVEKIEHLSDSDDTILLSQALGAIQKNLSGDLILDLENAGTVYRFLIPYLSAGVGRVTLKGNNRMNERPIGPLVECLRLMGANITYLAKDGFPPIEIQGSSLKGGICSLDMSQSSQFGSALLLLGPTLEGGITLSIENVTSRPYLDMTVEIMRHFGIDVQSTTEKITIHNQPYKITGYSVESDWSAASYYYEMAILSDNIEIFLEGLKKESVQGDSNIADIARLFGIETEYHMDGILLHKKAQKKHDRGLNISLLDTPDLAPALFCACAGSGLDVRFTGIRNLKIKESDRKKSLIKELGKFGASFSEITDDQVRIAPSLGISEMKEAKRVDSHGDHRIAMSMAPLAIKAGRLIIEDAHVVSKSYPTYWSDLRSLGFDVRELS